MTTQKIVKVGRNEGKKMIVKNLPGADITMIIDGQTAGSKYLSESITKIQPGVTLTPSHSHKDIEEIIYVLEGQGQVWIEGQSCDIKKGDSVLFPASSIHTTRNTGTDELILLCLFSTPQYRKEGAYCRHEGIGFDDD